MRWPLGRDKQVALEIVFFFFFERVDAGNSPSDGSPKIEKTMLNYRAGCTLNNLEEEKLKKDGRQVGD